MGIKTGSVNQWTHLNQLPGKSYPQPEGIVYLYTKFPPCQQNLIPRAARKPWLLLHTQSTSGFELVLCQITACDPCSNLTHLKDTQNSHHFISSHLRRDLILNTKTVNTPSNQYSYTFFLLKESSKLEGSIAFFTAVSTDATVSHLVNLAPNLKEAL